MVSSNVLKNSFKSPQIDASTVGNIGYDNPRENIDPHLKTKVLSTKEISTTAKINTTGYTQGSVIFVSGSKFEQNNSKFFWDATNSRLGIGTSSPGTDFHISSGTGSGSANLVVNSTHPTDPRGTIELHSNGTVRGTLQGESGDLRISSVGSVPLILAANSVEVMRIAVGGSVSIGGVTPSDLFHINSAAASNAILRYSIGGSSYALIGLAGATDNIIAGSRIGDYVLRTVNKAMLFSVDNGTTSLLNMSGASIGVGLVANSANKLEVTGRISGTNIMAGNGFTGTGAYTTLTISGGIVLNAV